MRHSSGFADPIAYFLIGVLTLGVAVARSGLAERVAHLLLARGRGRAGALYAHLLLALPLLTLLLPSATTRTGILVHVYDQAFTLGRVPPGAPLARAIMLVLNSVNRLSSTILLTGGITPDRGRRPHRHDLVDALVRAHERAVPGPDHASPPPPSICATATASTRDVQVPPRPDAASALGRRVAHRADHRGCGTALAHRLRPPLASHVARPAGLGVLPDARRGRADLAQFEQEVGWANFFVTRGVAVAGPGPLRSGASAWLAGGVVGAARSVAESP